MSGCLAEKQCLRNCSAFQIANYPNKNNNENSSIGTKSMTMNNSAYVYPSQGICYNVEGFLTSNRWIVSIQEVIGICEHKTHIKLECFAVHQIRIG